MDELSFKKELLKIRALAKSQGDAISKEQIGALLTPEDIKAEHLEFLYAYLLEEKIRLFDTEEERRLNEEKGGFSEDDRKSGYLTERAERLRKLESVLNREERRAQDINSVFAEIYCDAVGDIARLYEGQGVPAEDLVGEGNVALLLAAGASEMCDSAEEVDELVTRMIMDAMEKAIMDDLDNDSFMDDVLLRVNKLNDAARELSETLERRVTIEEISKEMSLDPDEIMEIIYLSGDNIEYIEVTKGENT